MTLRSVSSLGTAGAVVLAVQRGLLARTRRLDDLRARVFDLDLDEATRDTRVLVYLTVRARMPWLALAWHDLCWVFSGVRPQHSTELFVWRHHLDRLGLDDAHRRPSCRLVRS